MTQWIDCRFSSPPDDIDVLLLLAQYRSDSGFLWDVFIVKGFYTGEQEGENKYFVERVDFDCIGKNKLDACHEPALIDSKYIKVIAWTLPPSKPCNHELKIEKKIDIN
jgi:hypothetical protein